MSPELPPLPIENYGDEDGRWNEKRGPYDAEQMRAYGLQCRNAALVEAALSASHEHSAEQTNWREHVEEKLYLWRTTAGEDGDLFSLSDLIGEHTFDDLVDFVCDEFAPLYTLPQLVEPVNQQLLEEKLIETRKDKNTAIRCWREAENRTIKVEAAFAALNGDNARLRERAERAEKKVQAQDAALDFAYGYISDAIYTEGDFDGDTGQRVLHIITEAKERGEFDRAKYGDLDHLCPFVRAENLRAELYALKR